MGVESAGFITHRELDPLVGYPRKRERWQESGHLPAPCRVNAYRQRALLFPELVLICLVVPRGLSSARSIVPLVHEACDRLYQAPALEEITAVVRSRLKERHWTYQLLLEELEQQSPDALCEWREEVAAQELELTDAGVRIAAATGRIQAVRGRAYSVWLSNTNELRRVSEESAPEALQPGAWVTWQTVSVGPHSREFLLPTLQPVDFDADQTTSTDDELIDWFKEAMGHPRPVAAPVEETLEEEPPVLHRDPLVAPRETWRGGGAMSRRLTTLLE